MRRSCREVEACRLRRGSSPIRIRATIPIRRQAAAALLLPSAAVARSRLDARDDRPVQAGSRSGALASGPTPGAAGSRSDALARQAGRRSDVSARQADRSDAWDTLGRQLEVTAQLFLLDAQVLPPADDEI